jgi:hypothetical protein
VPGADDFVAPDDLSGLADAQSDTDDSASGDEPTQPES